MPINYEKDPLKHYVRIDGWLKAIQQQKEAIANRLEEIPLRYFTLCAAQAIDVFMLERKGILNRSEETGRLEGVYFCERDDENFGKIASLIGSPENGFHGTFEDIVLFKDDQNTIGKSWTDELEDEPYTRKIRKRLRHKREHHRLRDAFPFDIINLDVCGIMFPLKEGVIAPLLESIIQILEWQTESKFSTDERICKQFTLFLTSHISQDRTNLEAIQQLENRVNENLCMNEHFKSAFVEQYGHDQVTQLACENFPEFFRVAFFKYLIDKALSTDLGWTVTSGPTYFYNRDDNEVENKQYQIMHAVSVYKRIPNFQKLPDDHNRAKYIQSVLEHVNAGVQWVDEIISDPNIEIKLEEDLKQIVKFRDLCRNL